MRLLIHKLKRGYRTFRVKRMIRREFRELFGLVTYVDSLGEKAVKKINWNKEQIHFYSVNVLAQNLHKLKSITVLISNGYSSDAWQIFRPLIESVLDFDYILRNPQKLDLYFQYSIYLDVERIKRIQSVKPLIGDNLVQFEKMKGEWEKHKSLFTHKGKVRRSWRDKPLKDIAQEIKMGDIYSLGYKNANDYSHGNSNLIQPFVKGKNSKGLMLKAGSTFEKREILIIFPSTLVLMFQMIMRANKFFELGLNDEVKRLDKAIVKYCSKIGKSGELR